MGHLVRRRLRCPMPDRWKHGQRRQNHTGTAAQNGEQADGTGRVDGGRVCAIHRFGMARRAAGMFLRVAGLMPVEQVMAEVHPRHQPEQGENLRRRPDAPPEKPSWTGKEQEGYNLACRWNGGT